MRQFRFLFRPLFAALVGVWLASGVFPAVTASAQDAAPAAPVEAAIAANAAVQQLRDELAAAQEKLDELVEMAERHKEDDARLVEIKAEADEVNRNVVKASVGLRPRFDEIKARLEELGNPPGEGQPPETAVVTDERNRLIAERAEINALTGEAESVSIAATNLSHRITATRRALFTETLFRRTELSSNLFHHAVGAVSSEFATFQRTFGSWLNFVWSFKRLQLLSALGLSLAAGLFFLSGGYRLFGRFVRRSSVQGDPSYIARLSFAFWSTIIQTLSLFAFLVSSAFFLDSFHVLRTDIAPIVMTALAFIGLIYFIAKLTYAVFAPGQPAWRLVKVSNSGARALTVAILAMAIANGLDYLLGGISAALNSPVVLTVVKSFVASVIVGFIMIAVSFLKPVLNRNGNPEDPGRPWPRSVRFFLWFSGALLILAALTGYIGLARFVSTQIVLTGALLVTMYIGILSGKAVSKQGVFPETAVGRFLKERYGLGEIAIDQIGLGAGLGIYALALLFGIPLILFSWGFQIRDLELWAFHFFNEITIGNISISLIGIFGGILVFSLGMLLTRWFQKWLDGNVMARSQVDAGVRNSVKTGVGYLGIALAGLVGVSAAGINLSSLALVAGALSLGIGFGLQNIVSNFVSGLILLVERPFKVGDWVVTGATEGFVRRISVRATEIETFRRQSIIVPNSELINASVGNWTHRNRLGRSEIAVSVSYDADPRKVMDILLELVRSNPLVLRNPEPGVEFVRFGESSLDFEVRFFLADLFEGMKVRNELRIQILERFRAEGIEMPFPQRNLNLRLDADSLALVARLEEERGGVQAAAEASGPTPESETTEDGQLRSPPQDGKNRE